jgi:uncharacterized protein involved in exopolysaccharide biosynthesis
VPAKQTLKEINPMATAKAPRKSAAQKLVEKLQGQLKALKEKRKTLADQITAKQAELTKAKEAVQMQKTATSSTTDAK